MRSKLATRIEKGKEDEEKEQEHSQAAVGRAAPAAKQLAKPNAAQNDREAAYRQAITGMKTNLKRLVSEDQKDKARERVEPTVDG